MFAAEIFVHRSASLSSSNSSSSSSAFCFLESLRFSCSLVSRAVSSDTSSSKFSATNSVDSRLKIRCAARLRIRSSLLLRFCARTTMLASKMRRAFIFLLGRIVLLARANSARQFGSLTDHCLTRCRETFAARPASVYEPLRINSLSARARRGCKTGWGELASCERAIDKSPFAPRGSIFAESTGTFYGRFWPAPEISQVLRCVTLHHPLL